MITEIKCNKCNNDLSNASMFRGFYSCDKCNRWTNNVTIKTVPLIRKVKDES